MLSNKNKHSMLFVSFVGLSLGRMAAGLAEENYADDDDDDGEGLDDYETAEAAASSRGVSRGSLSSPIAALRGPQQFEALESLCAAIDAAASDAAANAIGNEVRRVGGVAMLGQLLVSCVQSPCAGSEGSEQLGVIRRILFVARSLRLHAGLVALWPRVSPFGWLSGCTCGPACPCVSLRAKRLRTALVRYTLAAPRRTFPHRRTTRPFTEFRRSPRSSPRWPCGRLRAPKPRGSLNDQRSTNTDFIRVDGSSLYS